MKRTRPQLRYSEEFKRMVVQEIESGIMSITQAVRYYGLGSTMSVYKWLSQYGLNEIKGRKVVVMTHKEETELITLRRELALLKKELEEAELRAIAWKSMVDAIEQDLKIEVKKKPWNQALSDARKQLYGREDASAWTGSAGFMDSANKPDTSAERPTQRKRKITK